MSDISGVNMAVLRDCIENYLRQCGLPLHKPFRCLSPVHEDRHPSMRYNRRAKSVHCFSCGETYDIFSLVGLDYGIEEFPKRVQKVCELFGYQDMTADKAHGTACVGERGDGEYGYFLSRGITLQCCERHGLYQKNGRAYFPVGDGGFCSRAMEDSTLPRYKNSKGPLDLWNGDCIGSGGNGRLLFVTEGIIDAICLEQLGYAALSLCGSQNTRKLLRRCKENAATAGTWRFVVCGDPDEAGRKMNSVLQEGLSALGIDCSILPLETSDGDVGALYQRDRERLLVLISSLSKEVAEYALPSAADCLKTFFAGTDRGGVAVSTGFPRLDKLLDGGLYAGLYVLGAISSLGKTSLALQIADSIAEGGGNVLYFSLEQSRKELLAKSLCRTSARLCGGDFAGAFTVRQLLGAAFDVSGHSQLLHAATQAYSCAGVGLYIKEGAADIGVAEIRQAVRDHLAYCGKNPVVVVDYLQILRPADGRATDKQNTDRAVVELKRLSRDFDIPVIAISSFNRENYRAAVSMEAFKESGAVEYSSDVLLGLQLQGAGSKDFDVNAEKIRDPRRVELVILKNRNGIPYAKIPLRYYAKYSLFQEGRAVRTAASLR